MTFLRRILFAASALALIGMVSAANAKPFEFLSMSQEAAKLERQITGNVSTADRPAADWIKDGIAAVKKEDWRAAAAAFGAAIAADPSSEQAWRNYAVSLLKIDPRDDEKYEFPRRARSAAYQAYMLSKDAKSEARALAVLADAYGRRSEWRPGLNAYAESLRLDDRQDVRDAYTEMRREHGFRVTDYNVESDATSPRACIEFSESLPRGRIDYAPFVSVSGIEKPAVTGTGDQICVDGLKHGETYNVTVRAGVPSSVGEDTMEPHEISVYVRDRDPMVRFTGRNYVLPRTGQQGIPFVSVNLDRVGVEIYRVGDRGLGPQITDGDFQQQLNSSQIATLKEDAGARIFEGQIDVSRKLNEEVTTAFPIEETIKTLEPGVYVMVARNPDKPDEDYENQATQWFVVSDIGLSELSAGDGIHAFVRSLASADPIVDADIKLVARNNEVLATAKSDKAGYVRFDAGLAKGEGGLAPAFITASSKGDYGFLLVNQPGYDLSDRGVDGRQPPGPLDALVYTERGVYRPGETVHLTTLLRDQDGIGVTSMPLIFILKRPDGAEDRRVVVADQGAGGRTLDLPILDTATTGTWRVEAYADPKGSPVGEAVFLVEDYMPQKLEMTVATEAKTFTDAGLPLAVDGRWLYGAPAADLALEGEVTIQTTSADLPGFPGYKFGLSDEEIAPVRVPVEGLSRTDEQGKATVDIPRPTLPDTERPLQARISVSLREPGGRSLERSLKLPVDSARPRIGVKPLFDTLGEGETANFEVILLGADGKAIDGKGLKWALSRLRIDYQWYSEGSSWQHEAVTTASRIGDGTIDVAAAQPAKIAQKLDYGRYRLDVTSADATGPATSVVFDSGWYSDEDADTPDTLDIALHKPMYRPGEKAKLRIDARFAGKATVAVVANNVLQTRALDVVQGENNVELDVTEDWRPGAYVLGFVYRPLDAQASRMPGRAIGVAHATIDPAPHVLPVALQTPAKAAPRGTLRVPVKVANIAAGEEASLVVAAVDVGILNLTNFKTPAPDEDAFAQRKLSAEVRDLYGQLIDGMRATRGKIRTGGDGAGLGMGEPPTQPPLALFSGIVKVGADGNAEIPLDLPAFNGKIRVMAMAWSKGKLGHAEKDVIVADPVVVMGSLPRFLSFGDTSRLRLDVNNVERSAGDYELTVVTSDTAVKLGTAGRKLALTKGQRTAVDVPLTASAVGHASIDVSLKTPDGQTLSQSFDINVSPAYPAVTSRSVVQLAPKTGSVTVSADMLNHFVPGTGSISLAVGPNATFDPAAIIGALETYPYGCSEQLSSRLVAILLADDFGVKLADDARGRAQQMIARILSRQTSAGGFGLWSPSDDDLWLDAYVSDVLTRAREKGYQVPELAVSQALTRIRNTLAIRGEPDDDQEMNEAAYAHYVLARNGRPMIGDLRYLGESKIQEINSPLARAQIAAALAFAGDQARATKVFAAADEALKEPQIDELTRVDYGTRLRDSAGVLALAAESSVASVIPAVAKKVETARGDKSYLSTQENAWLLRASQALKVEASKLSLVVNGQPNKGAYNRTLRADELKQPVTVSNGSDGQISASITVRGSPVEAPAEEAHGLTIERHYFKLDGTEVDPAQIAQNTRLVVTLKVIEREAQSGRILIVDHLPAGFEIDNPRLVSSAELSTFFWLNQEETPTHTEFRDDKFVASFERGEQADDPMVTAYMVRAVSPGLYVQGPATAEDMYRPDRYGRTASGKIEVGAPK